MFTNCVVLWVADFTLLVDKPSNFLLRNVKETTLYPMVNSLLLWTIFIYNFLHGMYMEIQLNVPLLFTNDVSMVSIDVRSGQPGDEKAWGCRIEMLL
jgi:hypothetical protein